MQPPREEANGMKALRVFLHKSLWIHASDRDPSSNSSERNVADRVSQKGQEKTLGSPIRPTGGFVGRRRSLTRQRKGGLVAAARTGADSNKTSTAPPPPAPPLTTPPKDVISSLRDDAAAADESSLAEKQPEEDILPGARRVSFSEVVKEVLIENRQQTYGNKDSRRQHFYSKAELAIFKRAWYWHIKSNRWPVDRLMRCGCPGCDLDEWHVSPPVQEVSTDDYDRWTWEG